MYRFQEALALRKGYRPLADIFRRRADVWVIQRRVKVVGRKRSKNRKSTRLNSSHPSTPLSPPPPLSRRAAAPKGPPPTGEQSPPPRFCGGARGAGKVGGQKTKK